MTKFTIKQLARLVEPGQLGVNQELTTLIFRPYNAHDPRAEFLAKETNWKRVAGREYVLQATATLENYYFLAETGLKFNPTERLQRWYYDLVDKNFDPASINADVLFDYQREGAYFLSLRDRAMLSLSPGLGKTLTSAYAAGVRGFDNILAIVPASLLFYWKGELEKWSDKLPRRPQINILHRDKTYTFIKQPVQDTDQYWVITNPETAVKRANEIVIANPRFQCLIADESIMYKHRDSARSQTMKELARHFETVWFLTGAPATKNLDDMWHQFHILKPQGYPSYWRFARKYCRVHDDEWGSKIIGNQYGAEKEIKKNFKDIYFSRTQDDVADIPDWIMEDIDIPMPPAQDKAYNTLREELYVRLESIDPNEVITVSNHLAMMVRSVQVASNPLLLGGVDSAGKWDALPELMKIYPGPYLIWVNFISTGHILRDRLSNGDYGKINLALANGQTKMEDRNKIVDAFQRGELDAVILNNQVGKFGFTLTRARTAFFVERMYDDSYFQCLHRNRRIGTTQSPYIINMRSVTGSGESTIDHLIHDTLDYRVGMIKKVTAADLKKVFAKKK